MSTHFYAISKGIAKFTVALIVLVAVQQSTSAQSPVSQGQATDVQQLKERLQQLEDTVRDLKGQIEAIEEAKKIPAPAIVEATYASVPSSPSAAPPKPAAKPQDEKGESTFEVYGFAMLDSGYQFKQNDPDWFDVVRPTKLP